MAFDPVLEARVRALLSSDDDIEVKKMFGGVGFMLRSKMACGIQENALIVRVGPEAYEAALAEPHTREFDITGRPMRGWIMVLPAGLEKESELKRWVIKGINFARTLPRK